MDFELVIVQGRSATTTLKLIDGVTTIGRHDECQLRIKSSQVSRKHCELFEKKGLLLVKDLGSSNGTLVNGKRIQGQKVLEAGDELTIGPVHLRVSKVGADAAATAGKTTGSPGDTAVTVPVAPTGESDDFTIAFDDPTEEPEAAAVAPTVPAPNSGTKGKKAVAQDDDAIADFLMDIEIEGDEKETTTTPSKPSSTPVPAAQPETEKPGVQAIPVGENVEAKEPAKEKEVSDDAIADFLLDIKLDDDE